MFRSAAHVERRRRLLPLMAAAGVTLAASQVRAAAVDRIQLRWVAPPGCPQLADVRARIHQLAGGTPMDGDPIQAEATVVRTPSGRLHLTLVVRTGDSVGRREIEADACADLAGATAVNVALLLRSAPQPTAAARDGASPPSVDGAREQPATAHATSPPSARTRAASQANPAAPLAALEHPSRAWHGLVRLPLMAARIGLLPSASWGAALAIGIQVEHWSIRIDGGVWLRQTLPAANMLDVTAHVDRVTLGLWACHGFSIGALELAPCAGLALQHIWTRGAGAHIDARTAQATWPAPGLGGQARWPLTRWLGLAASVDVQAQTARPSIMVDGVGRIGHLGPLAITFLLGSEWIL
jgi:hypothetical protein